MTTAVATQTVEQNQGNRNPGNVSDLATLASMTGKWLAALERAHRRGVHLLDMGSMRADGAIVWRVSSGSTQGYHHLVRLRNDTLLCSCPAGERPGILCAHRAVVLSVIVAGALRGTLGAARHVVEIPDPDGPARSRKGAPLSPRAARRLAVEVLVTSTTPGERAPARAVDAPAARAPRETTLAERDTAILRRSQQPFSFWR